METKMCYARGSIGGTAADNCATDMDAEELLACFRRLEALAASRAAEGDEAGARRWRERAELVFNLVEDARAKTAHEAAVRTRVAARGFVRGVMTAPEGESVLD